MPNDFILSQIFDLNLILKFASLIFLGIYIIFSVIVFNQVRTMNRIIITKTISPTMELISIINIIIALSLFIYSLVIL